MMVMMTILSVILTLEKLTVETIAVIVAIVVVMVVMMTMTMTMTMLLLWVIS